MATSDSSSTAGPITKSPCLDVCDFNKHKICKACGRTKSEKKQWKQLSDAEKNAVWTRILETHGEGDKKYARRLRKRHRKATRSRQTTGE